MSVPANFMSELRKDVESGHVALLLGAGVSAALSGGSEVATWKGLLADGIRSISAIKPTSSATESVLTLLDGDTDDLVTAAQWLKSKFSHVPGEYSNWLIRTAGTLPLADSSLATALPQARYVITTNYDELIENAIDRKPLTWTSRNAFNEYQRNSQDYVFHLHGFYREPDSVILGGEDYGRLEQDQHVHELLTKLARSHSLLMIGYGAGLDDPNFVRLTDWLKREQGESEYRHYLLVTRAQSESVDYIENLRRRVTPIVYGEDHGELSGFLNSLSTPEIRGTAPVAIPPADAVATAAGPEGQNLGLATYDTLFRDILPAPVIKELEARLGEINHLSDFQRAALNLCLRLGSNAKSALLCAVTGTGKTTLARLAMNLAVGSRHAGIALLPTKALVAQEVAQWNEWATIWGSETADRKIRVYGASRDYPEHDRPVSRGRYDIAIAIYEKLGVYLVSGRTPLSNTQVAVVDEFQTLVEDNERAEKLEAVLTMIRLMSSATRPAILGLSATLNPESTNAVSRWLSVDQEMLLTTNERPIPLDTYVVDPVGWKIQRDSHLFNIPGRIPPPATEYERHELSGRLHANTDALAGKIIHLESGELAATLVDAILEGDDQRRVLCFVPSRTAALEVASGIQALLKRRLGAVSRGSPWVTGRFARFYPQEDAEARYTALKYSDLPNCDDVIRGLREGVAAHTAAFPAALRRILEDEFRRNDGLLRVLVATDTLAVGINLPADTVVATSIAGYSGSPRRRRLLPPADLDNKAGRAGRRGETTRARGEFYLLVPSALALEGIDGLSTSDVRTLSTVEGVFDEFVTAVRRTAHIKSKYRTLRQISGLVLQILCQDGFAREESAWKARVHEILQGLLLAFEDGQILPSTADVLAELQSRQLVGRRANGKIALSGLGMALGRSGLDLDATVTLERLARLACANAGSIDLLWNACRSHTIQTATEWVALPPVASRHLPSLKEAVLEMGNAHCADSEMKRRYSSQVLTVGKHPIPDLLIEEGSPVISRELGELLSSDGERADDADVTALLRALVAYEWSRGISFGQIKARFSSAIRSEETQRGERPVELKVYYSDVEQLCDQIAGVIRGAADISISEDGLDFSPRMRNLATEVETGLPAWLAPIAKMRVPVLHRERLTFLWDTQSPPESLADILDDPQLKQHKGIREEDLADARQRIEVREEEERTQRNRVAQRWAGVLIPHGDGDTFEDLSDQLDKAASSTEYLHVLSSLIENLGGSWTPIQNSDYFAETQWSSPSQSLRVITPHNSLSREAMIAARSSVGLLVLRTRVGPDATAELSSPTRIRLVQPEHVLSFIASVLVARGPGLDVDEVVDGLSRIMVSSLDAESWYLYEPAALETPPPFVGSLPDVETALPVVPADESKMD